MVGHSRAPVAKYKKPKESLGLHRIRVRFGGDHDMNLPYVSGRESTVNLPLEIQGGALAPSRATTLSFSDQAQTTSYRDWHNGTRGLRNSRARELENSGTREFRNSRAQELENSGIGELGDSRTQELESSGTRELRNSRTQELENSGTRELRNS